MTMSNCLSPSVSFLFQSRAFPSSVFVAIYPEILATDNAVCTSHTDLLKNPLMSRWSEPLQFLLMEVRVSKEPFLVGYMQGLIIKIPGYMHQLFNESSFPCLH